MLAIKRSISFAIETKGLNADDTHKKKRTKADNTSRIRCVITWNGNRIRLGVNHRVNPDGWQPELQRCRAKTTHGKMKTPASTINHDIDELENLIEAVFRRFEEADKMPTKEEFGDAYDRISNPGKYEEKKDPTNSSIFPIFDKFIEDGVRSGRWGESTQCVTRTIRKHLRAIKKDLTFGELEQIGIGGLLEYFATVPDNEKNKGLSNRTILKNISFIRTFLRWANEHGYCDSIKLTVQKVRLKTAKKPVIFLTWEELMKVYNFDFGVKNYLSQVRDVFCFCCFTSLRYSDVRNLKRANISDSAITITTVKTHDTLTIELNNYSRAILAKYKDYELPNGSALPVITNQKMNEYLKELGELCELDAPVALTTYKGNTRIDKVCKKWELLSTHAGRRTFVCNALMLGIPPNIVMKWTGHSDYKAMRPYIEIADDAKKSAMSVFDKVGQKVGQESGDW